jgi:alginate O-acetyltransferase complex protein AlgI
MVFSSVSFLFFFLPLLFLVYFIVPKKFKNYVLLLFSLMFYFFGEKWYVFLLLLSCFFNYLFGIFIDKGKRKLFLVLGLLFNLGLLGYYKYTNFFIDTFNDIFNLNINTLKIILPLGISFFTFQNISYLIDVYRKDVASQKNFFVYSTYIALFPQLVAGPIVRYKDVRDELESRKESFASFSSGVVRFVTGLGKKVLIADTFYNIMTSVMKEPMTTLSYWLVALCFVFQIYYDFSGYSDMAIGLGKMFGFNFKENFEYPLISSSVTEFWRRWHMSLSSFFKDYVYIPLGGNRVSFVKNIRNIFVVWALTGLWHGSSWNFVLWGLYFFVFLIVEKLFLKKYLKSGVLSHLYTFLVILVSFVIFSVTELDQLVLFLKGMFFIDTKFISFESIYYFKISLVIILVAIIGMGPYLKNGINNLRKGKLSKYLSVFEVVYVLFIFILSVASIISTSFNPFIYFRF